MQEFKVGDRVRTKVDCHSRDNGTIRRKGYEYTIAQIILQSTTYVCRESINVTDGIEAEKLELITNNKINMDMKEKFALAFKKEPEKSFRKAGITNGDDFLTTDGQSIFLSWLLKKNGEDFKKEVVDDLLKEMESDK